MAQSDGGKKSDGEAVHHCERHRWLGWSDCAHCAALTAPCAKHALLGCEPCADLARRRSRIKEQRAQRKARGREKALRALGGDR